MTSTPMNEASNAPAEDAAEVADETSPESKRPSRKSPSTPSGRMKLKKLAGTHALTFLVALSLFAAADSWSTITGLGIATFLSVITGALAGVTVATLVHEWFHLAGARYVGAAYKIPSRQGLFLYEWDFGSNTARQFLIMSVAGSIGGFFAIFMLWIAVPTDNWGRAALLGGAIAGVVYAATIEWPVIKRTRNGGDPLTELSRINQAVLSRSFYVASACGLVMTWLLVP